eukprot:TRINITY_DN6597_c0_g1_i29.p1 TRINITY_DN6597_c0_g1~~TRINITY_DN6597_c0_g1_i29.p1  ORF type:complete len:223 (+),score=29.56 TRINITY_DN6597_c0_g1_i29:1603-2271(+)
MLMNNFKENYKRKLPAIVGEIIEEMKTGKYQGQEITLSSDIKDQCMKFAKEITKLLTKFLKARFPETDFLKNLKSLELNYASESDLTAIYGNTQLEQTMKRFHRCANVMWPPNQLKFEELVKEWDGVKMFAKKLKRDGVTDVESFVNLQCAEIYPNYIKLMKILNCIPASTADVERAFSHRTVVKSKYRTTLSAEQLDQLLRIKIESSKFYEKQIVGRAFGL